MEYLRYPIHLWPRRFSWPTRLLTVPYRNNWFIEKFWISILKHCLFHWCLNHPFAKSSLPNLHPPRIFLLLHLLFCLAQFTSWFIWPQHWSHSRYCQVQYWKCNYAFVIHHVFATTESAASKALGLRRSKGQQTLEMNSCIIIAATSESARNERDNMHSRICKVDLFAHYIKTPIFVQKLPLDKTFLVNQFEFLRQNSTIF